MVEENEEADEEADDEVDDGHPEGGVDDEEEEEESEEEDSVESDEQAEEQDDGVASFVVHSDGVRRWKGKGKGKVGKPEKFTCFRCGAVESHYAFHCPNPQR